MNTTLTGILTRVEREPVGSDVVVDASAGDTAITVDWLLGFDEDGGTMLLDDTSTLTYSACVEDETTGQGLLTVDPLEGPISAGTAVVPLDAQGLPQVEWTAWVAVDDDGQVIGGVKADDVLEALEAQRTPAGQERSDSGGG